ncbi:ThuA domain-containing protein [Hufsiella ginkgonis]|uniref:ThuA domain-containing protein n=1 Tax=Hufsiella ginkgonis TaxID=2695274 RepID=A0A7K1XZL5_9SPHI|nr:ThuA domain-containing protein [Hufsiella ginkgonis]MXV16454.1 ThuA domain-containing protein [Hufsiella ginkgonis]
MGIKKITSACYAERAGARKRLLFSTIFLLFCSPVFAQSTFKVLAFYSNTVERDHVVFKRDALKYFARLAEKKHFTFDSTTHWSDMNEEKLRDYQVVMWINDFPQNPAQRAVFEKYMESGGGWLGFHVAAYNDRYTKWPWYLAFLGGGVFHMNNWPPLPVQLIVDNRKHPVTHRMPAVYRAPANEWYTWEPSPRLNKDVTVLVTLDPVNYPLGIKDQIRGGDTPVVWTNNKYNMLYMNMGHGSHIFTSDLQNKMFGDAILWLGRKNK